MRLYKYSFDDHDGDDELRQESLAAAIERDNSLFEIQAFIYELGKNGEILNKLGTDLFIYVVARCLFDEKEVFLHGDFNSVIIRVSPKDLAHLALRGEGDIPVIVEFDDRKFAAKWSIVEVISTILRVDGDKNIVTLEYDCDDGVGTRSIMLMQDSDGEDYVIALKDDKAEGKLEDKEE